MSPLGVVANVLDFDIVINPTHLLILLLFLTTPSISASQLVVEYSWPHLSLPLSLSLSLALPYTNITQPNQEFIWGVFITMSFYSVFPLDVTLYKIWRDIPKRDHDESQQIGLSI